MKIKLILMGAVLLTANIVAICNYTNHSNSVFTKAFGVENAETPKDAIYNMMKSDCVYTIEGNAGVTGTVFGVSYTIPASGKISVTISNHDVDCPAGSCYYDCDDTTC